MFLPNRLTIHSLWSSRFLWTPMLPMTW